MEVNKERRHWTNVNSFYKRYFTEKILPIFDDHFMVDNCSIPFLVFNQESEESLETTISYLGPIDLNACLLGGYVYEYVFNADVNSENAWFSQTGDVDIPVRISDIFSDEFNNVNINKLDKSEFFNSIITQIIERLVNLDYTELEHLDPLNDLPDIEDNIIYYEKNKVRFVIEDSTIEGNMIHKKIQIMICKNDIYEEIVDLMIVFEISVNSYNTEFITKKCYDGSIREIKYTSKKNLLSSEINALLARYTYPEVITKTRNHLGRILFLLTLIDISTNEIDKYAAKSTCEHLLARLCSLLNNSSSKESSLTVICDYKGEIFTFADMVSPIKQYCLKKHSQRFIQVFGPLK